MPKRTVRAMRSGELAAAAGVSPDTLRHYEKSGLLPTPKRLPNGYRAYPPETLDQVRLIQRGLAIGFSLSELCLFLEARRAGSPPCGKVHALAAERLAELERRIEELSRFRDDFRRILDDWSARLAGTPKGSPARLLESLTSLPAASEAGALRGMRFVNPRRKENKS